MKEHRDEKVKAMPLRDIVKMFCMVQSKNLTETTLYFQKPDAGK